MENLNLVDITALSALVGVIFLILRWAFKRMDEQSQFTERLAEQSIASHQKLSESSIKAIDKVSAVLDMLCDSIDVVGGKQAQGQERILEALVNLSQKSTKEHEALLEHIESYKPAADLVRQLARELPSD